MKERLSGFDGPPRSPLARGTDEEFPDYERSGPAPIQFPTGNGPVQLRDADAVRRDVAIFAAAAASSNPGGLFMTAASPGVIDTFMPSSFYASERGGKRFSGKSEQKLQAELHNSRRSGAEDAAKARARQHRIRIVEVYLIKEVEEFGAELHLLRFGNREVLESREIPIHETRARTQGFFPPFRSGWQRP